MLLFDSIRTIQNSKCLLASAGRPSMRTISRAQHGLSHLVDQHSRAAWRPLAALQRKAPRRLWQYMSADHLEADAGAARACASRSGGTILCELVPPANASSSRQATSAPHRRQAAIHARKQPILWHELQRPADGDVEDVSCDPLGGRSDRGEAQLRRTTLPVRIRSDEARHGGIAGARRVA